jgi:hypothetical protein
MRAISSVFTAMVVSLCVSSVGAAQSVSEACGEPIPVENETIKGNIEGKVALLARSLGSVGLTGEIEVVRREIFSEYPDASAARKDAYLQYMICHTIMGDENITTRERLDLIFEVRRRFNDPINMLADQNEFFELQATEAKLSVDGKRLIIETTLKSRSDENYKIALKHPSASAHDSESYIYEITGLSGAQPSNCNHFTMTASEWTLISPGSEQGLIFQFAKEESGTSAELASFSSSFCIRREKEKQTMVSVGIRNIPLDN